MATQSWFEKNAKLTLSFIVLIFAVILILCLNITAKKLFGLGTVVIYEAHPVYGYRPQASQSIKRRHIEIKINNLGLRADEDWDDNPKNKILFLGDSVTYGGSSIKNSELFSTIAGKDLPKYKTGNAGVNGWGVDNIHALIKQWQFLPADSYITTLVEGDFYRGLMRIGGQPYWTKQPEYALEEIFQYGVYKLNLKRMPAHHFYLSSNFDKQKIVNLSCQKLKELDEYLKEINKKHLIFISPSRQQVFGSIPRDQLVEVGLQKYNISATYIKDNLEKGLSKQDIDNLYYDEVHLSKIGHKAWGEIIHKSLDKQTKL